MDNRLQSQLQPLREEIDRIDQEILSLLNRRAQTAQQVGKVKEAFDAGGPVLDHQAGAHRHGGVLGAPATWAVDVERFLSEFMSRIGAVAADD